MMNSFVANLPFFVMHAVANIFFSSRRHAQDEIESERDSYVKSNSFFSLSVEVGDVADFFVKNDAAATF